MSTVDRYPAKWSSRTRTEVQGCSISSKKTPWRQCARNHRYCSQNSSRCRGATVLAVLILLFIVCLLAHQSARTLFILRQGQDYSLQVEQAHEILELGRQMERRFSQEWQQVSSDPVIVDMGGEYARLDFIRSSNQSSETGLSTIPESNDNEVQEDTGQTMDANNPQPLIVRIIATWPVDGQGQELPSQLPVVVTWERQ